MKWPWNRRRGRWAQHPCSPPLTMPGHLAVVPGDQWLCHCDRRWVVVDTKLYESLDGTRFYRLGWQEDGYHIEGTEKAQVDKTIEVMEANWDADS